MKKSIYLFALAALVMNSCSDYFDKHHLDNGDTPVTDVRTGMTYVLEEGDYATIAKLPANIAKALAANDDSATYKALQSLGKEKAFDDIISADAYVPAFMQEKFPYLDNGTTCDVTYTYREGKSKRVVPFGNALSHTMTTDNYESIWQKRGADYLTPKTVNQIPNVLANQFAAAPVGKLALVTYNYTTTEPNMADLSDFLPYSLTLSELLVFPDFVEHEIIGMVGTVKSTTSGRFYLKDGNDSVYVYGLTDDEGKKVWKDKNIQQGDSIIIRGKYIDATRDESLTEPQIINAVYVSHTPANIASSAPSRPQRVVAADAKVLTVIYQLTDDGWVEYTNDQVQGVSALPQSVYEALGTTTVTDMNTIITYLTNLYPYAKENDTYLVAYTGSNGMTADEFVYDGTTFVQSTGYIEETMSFNVKNRQWVANVSTFLQAAFVGEGLGKFTIYHVNLDGLNYVWRYQALYGATASAYVGGTNHRVEDWLVSPTVKLKKAVAPQLRYDNAVRYGNTTDNPTWLSVMITPAANFTGDVTTTEWTKMPFPAELPDGSNWIFQSSGIYDLTPYVGQSVIIAFRYKTDFDGIDVPSAPTWEIQNLLVAEPEVFEEAAQQ